MCLNFWFRSQTLFFSRTNYRKRPLCCTRWIALISKFPTDIKHTKRTSLKRTLLTERNTPTLIEMNIGRAAEKWMQSGKYTLTPSQVVSHNTGSSKTQRLNKRVPHFEWNTQFLDSGHVLPQSYFPSRNKHSLSHPKLQCVIELVRYLIRFATRIDAVVLHARTILYHIPRWTE